MSKRNPIDEDQILDLPSSAIVSPEIQSEPLVVTLIGAPFRTPRGVERSLRYSLLVPDGNVSKSLATIRKNGGVYFQRPDKQGANWFLPWPPAAIKITSSPPVPQNADNRGNVKTADAPKVPPSRDKSTI